MAGSPRRTQPSALDGFRRLERTRSVVLGQQSVRASVATLEPTHGRRHSPRGSARRVAGMARLVAFAAALVVIVGTSASLANSGSGPAPAELEAPTHRTAQKERAVTRTDAAVTRKDATARRAEPAETRTKAAGVGQGKSTPGEGTGSARATIVEPISRTPATQATAATAGAAGAAPTGTLPFTGPTEALLRALLAGSLLVVLGMLVQVAGQPLPARAGSRR